MSKEPLGSIMGLDISTSITGWTILNPKGELVAMGHIDLRKYKGMWSKVDIAKLELRRILQKHSIRALFIEESLQTFRSGMSSAHTLSTLTKFNGLLSYIARDILGQDPVYISASSARKSCGIKIKRGKDQLPAKKQAFHWVTDKLNRAWPVTRNGNIQQYCYDEADSFVIATAGWLQLLHDKHKQT